MRHTSRQLATLGRLELTVGGERVLAGRRKVLALLAYLARRPSRPIRREHLADLLWHASPALARQSLRQALSELRDVLGEGITADAEVVTLDASCVLLDLRSLEEDVAAANWTAAAARYEGEFLPGYEDVGGEAWREWLEQERGALARTAMTVFPRLIQDAEQRDDWLQALRGAERWRSILPESGEAAAAVTRLLPMARRPDALRQVRGLATPALVGRDVQLAALSAAWRRAQSGAGRVVVIEAEPGMGVSRLIEEFGRVVEASRPGGFVLTARAYASEHDVRNSLTRAFVLQLLDAPGLAGVPAEMLATLRSIAPEIEERFRQLPGAGATTLPQAIHRALTDVAADKPVLVTVDDAHAADEESLPVLTHLIRHPPAGCLLVLGTRSDDRLASVLAADYRQAAGHLDRIVLEGLDEESIIELLQSAAAFAPETSARLATMMRREVGGAPGRVVEILQLLIEGGVLRMDEDGVWSGPGAALALPVPAGAGERTRDRLKALSPPARGLLEGLAVLGEPATVDVLQQVSGDPDVAHEAMAELLARRWLREHASHPGRFAFTDDASRRVVYATLAPQRRRVLHRRAAQALAATDESSTMLADRVHRHRSLARPPWLPSRAVIMGAGAVVIVASGYLFTRGMTPRSAHSRVLVADVASHAGDTVLGRALTVAATISLSESRSVQVFPRERIRETLSRMGRAGADSVLDLELLREVAERENLDGVIGLAIDQLQGRFIVTGRIIDPVTGTSRGESRRTTGTPDDVVAKLDEVLADLRHELGESRQETRARRPLPLATTSSIEALRAYADGRTAWWRRPSEALPYWRRAVELDSAFAMALLALSDFHYWNNDRDSGTAYLRRARAHADRLTEREHLTLLATEAARLGHPEEAITQLRTMAERYPDRDTWHTLAGALMRQERCEEAIHAVQRSLDLDTLYAPAWVTLATCRQILDQPDSALAAYGRAEASEPGILYRGSLNLEWGRALVRLGKLDAADSVFGRMAAKDEPGDRAFGLRSLGFLAMMRGRYQQAAARFLESSVLSHERNSKVSEFRNRVLLSEVLLTMGQEANASRALDRAIALTREWNMEPGYHLILGHALVRAGRLPEVEAQLRMARAKATKRPVDQSALRLLEGWVQLARHDAERALAEVAEDRYEPYAAYRHALRADAFLRLGQLDSARLAAQALQSGFHFGYDSQDEWLRAPVRLGRLAREIRDTLAERQALASYLERWPGGDVSVPELVLARRRLAELDRQRR
ncbi:MAG: AAA family ATPase [Gemmatimonadaceae bacterium]|nr:AAA family ATPase [Gemmatimonadaceae bacterium]